MRLRATLAALLLAGVSPLATATEPTTAPTADAGVTGTISFRGEAPELEKVDLASDPFCVDGHADGLGHGIVLGTDNGLANVFIQLTDGVPDERFKAPKEAVQLDQRGCKYYPHVFGVMKKQDIEILNSDATLHNIHAIPKKNKEFNKGMPTKGMKLTEKFKKAEEAIVIKCDVHPWMKAYAFCMEHPYFTTTDENGKFTLPTTDLADGEYGVKLWHETLGEAEAKVTVRGGKATLDHTFSM